MLRLLIQLLKAILSYLFYSDPSCIAEVPLLARFCSFAPGCHTFCSVCNIQHVAPDFSASLWCSALFFEQPPNSSPALLLCLGAVSLCGT